MPCALCWHWVEVPVWVPLSLAGASSSDLDAGAEVLPPEDADVARGVHGWLLFCSACWRVRLRHPLPALALWHQLDAATLDSGGVWPCGLCSLLTDRPAWWVLGSELPALPGPFGPLTLGRALWWWKCWWLPVCPRCLGPLLDQL